MIQNKRRGSIAIEAVVSFTISLLILIVLFGSIWSILLDDQMAWAALDTQSDLALCGNMFSGGGNELIDSVAMSAFATRFYSKNILKHQLSEAVSGSIPVIVTPDVHGAFTINMRYDYRLMAVREGAEIKIPVTGLFSSDGVDFDEKMVYITNTGIRYHRGDCFHLRKSKYGINLKEAVSRGYTPCKNCKP